MYIRLIGVMFIHLTKVFIDGKEGTTGLRIYDRLRARTDIELLLLSDAERKDPVLRAEMINASDLVFLCLPDDAARQSAALVKNNTTRLIDASTAHRTAPGWIYGLPELSSAHKNAVAESRRIAIPGCHAGGFVLLVYPLIRAGVLPAEAQLVCFSLTGYSGGGNKMIAQYRQDKAALRAPRQYGLAQTHKHLPEMQTIPGLRLPPIFCPTVADYYSGMEVTVPLFASQLTKPFGKEALYDLYQSHYADARLIRTARHDDAAFLAADAFSGKDTAELSVHGNADRLLLTARFDNLGKGASGAAIQCMNLALGMDETLGLVL